MLHENVKFDFKVTDAIEAHYITRLIFLFRRMTYKYMSFWELTNYCIPKRWPIWAAFS